MATDLKCPYCHTELEVCHDDGFCYEEDVSHEMQCGVCEKSFQFTTFISFSYTPHKADCLNDGQHNYELTKTYPPEFAVLRCTTCDHEKPNIATQKEQP